MMAFERVLGTGLGYFGAGPVLVALATISLAWIGITDLVEEWGVAVGVMFWGGPGGTVGQADNGRIFRFVFNADDPSVVDSFTVIADGDAVGTDAHVPFVDPDNVDTSKKSLMVQEDNDRARIWHYRMSQGDWRIVASVNDPDGESIGIVDATEFFGLGNWLLTVQTHGTNFDEEIADGITFKREDGPLILMKIPGS
jgi:hypothetical protein